MKKHYDNAKEIYFNYLGNTFFMGMDGIEDEYKKYNISKVTEREWDNELREYLINSIKKEKNLMKKEHMFLNFELFSERVQSIDNLEFMVIFIKDNIHKFDTFTTLRMCEDTIKLATQYSSSDKLKSKETINKVIGYLNTLKEQPVIISQDYYTGDSKPEHLSNNNIKKRINEIINKYSQSI